jgi:hypothetical protein
MPLKLPSLPVLALAGAVAWALWQGRRAFGLSGVAGGGLGLLGGHHGPRTHFGHHHGPRHQRRIFPSVPHGSQCFLTTAGWVRYDRLGIAYPCPMPIGFGAGLPVVTPFGAASY